MCAYTGMPLLCRLVMLTLSLPWRHCYRGTWDAIIAVAAVTVAADVAVAHAAALVASLAAIVGASVAVVAAQLLAVSSKATNMAKQQQQQQQK